jgi:hypothetical protein
MQVESIIKAELGSGVTIEIKSIVTKGHSGDHRQFFFECLQGDTTIYATDYPVLSEAIAQMHTMTMTEFAGSVYVTDCEDEKAFAEFA